MKRRMNWLLVGLLLASFLAVSMPAAAQSPVYEAVWPRGKVGIEDIPLATRPSALAGKTVCELWNYAFRGDETFPMLREELTKRYPDIKIVPYEEFGRTGGVNEAKNLADLPAKLKEKGCDVAIGGNGC